MTLRCRPASSISSADDLEGARSSPDRTHLVGEVQARTDRRAADDRLRLEITVLPSPPDVEIEPVDEGHGRIGGAYRPAPAKLGPARFGQL